MKQKLERISPVQVVHDPGMDFILLSSLKSAVHVMFSLTSVGTAQGCVPKAFWKAFTVPVGVFHLLFAPITYPGQGQNRLGSAAEHYACSYSGFSALLKDASAGQVPAHLKRNKHSAYFM